MIRVVFFDFGGVIAGLDREEMRRLEARYGLPEGGLWQAMFEVPEWELVQVGRETEERWLAAAGRRLDELAGRPIPQIREEWGAIWLGLRTEMVELVRRLRVRYRVGMISNALPNLEEILRERHGIFHLFDLVVNSSRVGLAKPDVRIYRLAARQLGVPPAACVHIDDLWENVEGARAAGFQAIHYNGDYPALERELRSLGLEW